MKLDKDILDHKKKASKKASKEYFDKTKNEIWESIQKEQTPVRSIQSSRSYKVWFISGLSAAAVIALVFTIWNFNTSSFEVEQNPQVAIEAKDSAFNSTAEQIPDDYYANNFELESIEEVYYEEIPMQDEISEDSTLIYEDYLLEQNIDESIILDELL